MTFLINLIENLVPNSLKINKPPVKLRVDNFYLLLRRDSNPQPLEAESDILSN